MPDEGEGLEQLPGQAEGDSPAVDDADWAEAGAGIPDAGADASREPEGDEGPGTVAESQGGDDEGTGDDDDNPFAGWTADDLDAVLRRMPDELREGSKELAELRRRAEQSAADRLRQQQEKLAQRAALHQQVLQAAEHARSSLETAYERVTRLRGELGRAIEAGDIEAIERSRGDLERLMDDEFWSDIQMYANGQRVAGIAEQVESMRQAAAKYKALVGEPDEEETRLIQEWQAYDAEHGTSITLGNMLDTLVAKAYVRGKTDAEAERAKAKADEERLNQKTDAELSRLERLRQFKAKGGEVKVPRTNGRRRPLAGLDLAMGGAPDDDFWAAAEAEVEKVKQLSRA